jgi:hypothetical protein
VINNICGKATSTTSVVKPHQQHLWESHINNISGKANKTLGFLRHNLNIGSTGFTTDVVGVALPLMLLMWLYHRCC